jgi:hypothetical protein
VQQAAKDMSAKLASAGKAAQTAVVSAEQQAVKVVSSAAAAAGGCCSCVFVGGFCSVGAFCSLGGVTQCGWVAQCGWQCGLLQDCWCSGQDKHRQYLLDSP